MNICVDDVKQCVLNTIIKNAMQTKNMALLQNWLYAMKQDIDCVLKFTTNRCYEVHVMKWLHQKFTPTHCTSTNCFLHIQTHTYYYKNCIKLASTTSASRYLHIIKWLDKNHHERLMDEMMDWIAATGHLNVVRWLHETQTNKKFTKHAIDYAARNGHLHVVQWLHENRSEGCTIQAMNCAAENGHLHVVRWLHENRSEGCTEYAMDCAAENGHLHVVKWLYENRKEGCSQWAIYGAFKNGHLDVVQLLHSKQKPRFSRFAMANIVIIKNVLMAKKYFCSLLDFS